MCIGMFTGMHTGMWVGMSTDTCADMQTCACEYVDALVEACAQAQGMWHRHRHAVTMVDG